MKYAFVECQRRQHSVRTLCRAVRVSPSGYYAARSRPPSARDQRQSSLTTKTKEVLPNLVRRCFKAERPNACWLSDVTYIPTREGWLYLAAVLDVYSRAIVGWAMSQTLGGQLTTNALAMAISRRGVPELVHSDRGSTYATSIYLDLMRKHGIRQSMSRKGNCWDNAPMESFFHSLKTELVMHCDYKTRDQARASLFDYMEVFYNRQRRHSTINYVAPLAFEESTSA